MEFTDFCAALRCEAMTGPHGIGYVIPTMTLQALQNAAGSLGTLNHKQHYVVLAFPMDDGTAIISGDLESGRLVNGWMFLLEWDRSRSGATRDE
jgi:hypothetical protein